MMIDMGFFVEGHPIFRVTSPSSLTLEKRQSRNCQVRQN